MHEDPRISRRRPDVDTDDAAVASRMVFTIEPGAYLPGWGGVRIEDDVLVTDAGVDVLTDVTTDLIEVLMDLEQIKQILDLVREHELSEFEIEHDGLRLKVRKDANGSHVVTLPAPPAPLVLPPSRRARPRRRRHRPPGDVCANDGCRPG